MEIEGKCKDVFFFLGVYFLFIAEKKQKVLL